MMHCGSMESYHYVWLSAHPERTEEWLLGCLADGFHVHHVDGDHANDDPKNLVLIESGDHMMLHNGAARLLWKPKKPKKSNNDCRKKSASIAELEEKLAPAIEKLDKAIAKLERAKARAFRIKMRDIARANMAAARAENLRVISI